MMGLAAALTAGRRLDGRGGVPPARRLLDEVARRGCRYFYEEADPSTGLVRDRARIASRDTRTVASIAATGFGLSALCIAHARGYLPREAAESRVRRTLEYLARHGHYHGFYYHFIEMRTGARAWTSELSSVDTTWLLCGVLHAREHFGTKTIRRLADEIVSRVDWPWMLAGGKTLCHGWTPEAGFLPYRWDSYSELLAMYLLALGSGAQPVSPECWHAWKRPQRSYRGLNWIDSSAPLFTHQYSHAWFDFRGRRDQYADYFENSRRATEANRLMCVECAGEYPWYGPDMWGVTAADTVAGYRACEGPDGTLVPCAAGGSLPFLPGACASVLAAMVERYGSRVWGRYGFVDAFNPGREWYSPDVIGINIGILVLMVENLRSGNVWREFMAAPEARRGMRAAGIVHA